MSAAIQSASSRTATHGTPCRAPAFESMELRRLMAVTAALSGNGVLTVTGTNGADTISLTQRGNSFYATGHSGSYDARKVKSIVVNAGGGNDTIKLDDASDGRTKITKPSTIHGGSGNDVISGTYGNDSLFGDGGRDTLSGDAGADKLDGGSDNDWLDAGSAGECVKGGGGEDFSAWDWAPGGAQAADMEQGATGSCVFLSSLAAATKIGAIHPENGIQYLGNFVYSVKLYISGQWKGVKVPFNGTLATDADNYYPFDTLPTQATTPGSDSLYKFWTVLYQRAYLQADFGIAWNDAAKHRNFSGEWDATNALTAILGRPSEWYSTSETTAQQMHDWIASGKAVVASTQDDTENFIAHHCYSVESVQKVDGKWTVTLRNPWGFDYTTGLPEDGNPNDGLITVSWSTFTANFDDGTRVS